MNEFIFKGQRIKSGDEIKVITREKEKAYEDIKASAGELAVLIASKLIEDQISIENQENLIDRFIEEVGSAKWQS